jgi:hypothetical protein
MRESIFAATLPRFGRADFVRALEPISTAHRILSGGRATTSVLTCQDILNDHWAETIRATAA